MSFAATDAPTTGSKVSYTTRETGGCQKFTVGSGDDKFVGSCIQMGVEAANGTATVGTPTTKMKKIAYYYGEVKGYWGSAKNGGHILGMSSSGTAYSEEAVVMYMLQAQNQGYANWQSICAASGGRLLDAGSAQAVVNILQNTDWNSIDLPDNFEMITLDCGNDQDGCAWRFAEKSGKLKLKKTSSNTSITG